MNIRLQSHFFWGPYGPFSALTGAGLFVMASVRFSYAVVCAGAFLWVFCMTALVYYSAGKFLPARGRPVILLFLSSLLCSIYILLVGFANPLLIYRIWFFMIMIPPCCMGAGLFTGMDSEPKADILSRVWLEALSYGLILIAFSLIREPLGTGALSLPGGPWGFFEIFWIGGGASGFFPVQIISIPAGGFIILGFAVALFRAMRSRQSIAGDES